jgi:hypothetical protein
MAKTPPLVRESIDAYIAELEEPLASVAVTLRDHINSSLSATEGRIWHGHPVWMIGSKPVAGFKAYPRYVTFMLWRGQEIRDDTGALQPAGAGTMAVLKVSYPAEVHGPALRRWLERAAELEAVPSAEESQER